MSHDEAGRAAYEAELLTNVDKTRGSFGAIYKTTSLFYGARPGGKSVEQQARDLLERMGDEDAHYISAGNLAELAQLIVDRDAARQRCDTLVKILTEIHGLLYPREIPAGGGLVWQFRPSNAHEILQKLSDRIRAIPDELAKAAT